MASGEDINIPKPIAPGIYEEYSQAEYADIYGRTPFISWVVRICLTSSQRKVVTLFIKHSPDPIQVKH